jgi:uncharacterized cupin superfamily protein
MMKVWKPTEQEIKNTESWNIWTKEISEFPWHYDDPETFLVLEGAAQVTDSDGNRIEFKKGDMVRFEKGVKCTWKIISDIEKRYNFG